MSEPSRAQTERDVLPKVGATFYRDDEGQLMFQFVVDTANVIGPRPANRGDQEKHAGAWAAFCAAEGVSALDRDGREGTGGSLPQESPAAPVQAPMTLDEINADLALRFPEGAFCTPDGKRHQTMAAAMAHVESVPELKAAAEKALAERAARAPEAAQAAPAPPPKRKYTRRSKD